MATHIMSNFDKLKLFVAAMQAQMQSQIDNLRLSLDAFGSVAADRFGDEAQELFAQVRERAGAIGAAMWFGAYSQCAYAAIEKRERIAELEREKSERWKKSIMAGQN